MAGEHEKAEKVMPAHPLRRADDEEQGFKFHSKLFDLYATGTQGIIGAVVFFLLCAMIYGMYAQHADIIQQLRVSNYIHTVTDPKELNEMRAKMKRPEGF